MLTPNGGVFGRNPKFNNVTVTGTSNVAGITTVSNTTASTSTTTGALVVSGGVGIGGAVRATDGFIGTAIRRIVGYNGLLDDAGFVAQTGLITASRAEGTCYCPSNDRIYVASLDANANGYAINPATNTVETVANFCGVRLAYCVTNDRIYAASGASSVIVVNPQTNAVVATITTNMATTRGIAYSPVNDRIYVTNSANDDITIITPSTNTVTVSDIAVGDQPQCICYCPSNNCLYVCNLGDDDVDVIDPATNAVVASVVVGDQPRDVCYCPRTDRIYVSNQGDDDITVIDPSTNTVDGSDIAVHDQPWGMSYNPYTNRIYVGTVGSSGLLQASVIDPTSRRVVQVRSVGQFAGAPVFCPSNGRTYLPNPLGATIAVLT